jgi:hypothetical protein
MKTEQKRTGWGTAWGAGVLALMALRAACAQTQPAGDSTPVLLPPPEAAPTESLAQEKILREIDDPRNGNRWLLLRDDKVPGGPGRMVLVAAHRDGLDGAFQASAAEEEKARIVVHAGDRLIVEEHTARADATLEACALASSAQGSALNVRLKIGGKVVRAVALGPGRAALQPETAVRP